MSIPNVETSTPVLYKIDSKGVTRVWRAWTTLEDDGSAIENNESGILDGVLSGIPIKVTKGKNIGRANETTPLQQANKNIASKLDKKLKEGYVESLEEYTQFGVMAAHPWAVRKKDMSPIALHQPKLDGIRCKAVMSDGNLALFSRSNKEFKPFLRELPWYQYLSENMENREEVDGEFYIHGLELNEIASLVMSYKLDQSELLGLSEDTDEGLLINLPAKEILDLIYTGYFQPEPEMVEQSNGSFRKANRFADSMNAIEVGRNKGWIFPGYTIEDLLVIGSSQLEYWLFDCPDSISSAEERNQRLADKWQNNEAERNNLMVVVADEFNIEDIEEVNAYWIGQGFEGTMVRKPSGLYRFGQRSADLLKFKLFYDAEWVIQDYELDREGNPTFVFISDAGTEFRCRPKGSRSWRAKLLSEIDQVIGQPATIQYQTLYQESLVPQFGRVVSIRNYE